MVRLAIDNNILAVFVGMHSKIEKYMETFDIPLREIKVENLFNKPPRGFRSLLEIFKQVVEGRIRLIVPPTVIKEVFDVDDLNLVKLKKSKVLKFFYRYSVEHVRFLPKESLMIEELKAELLKSKLITEFRNGEETNKEVFPIKGNNNKNFDHDAQIMCESCFSGADLLTMDSDYKNVELITEVIEEFENKYKDTDYEMTQNISNYKPYNPKSYLQKLNSLKQNFQNEIDF